jgi:phosphoglycolate phosphatase-like HAD superfamily hydrolase
VISDLVDEWSISPGRTVYIGDDPLDVAEARKAGVGALAAGWASTVDLPAIRAADPDELFLSVDELAIWLHIDETTEKAI